jgi:hypothetical protein
MKQTSYKLSKTLHSLEERFWGKIKHEPWIKIREGLWRDLWNLGVGHQIDQLHSILKGTDETD